MTTTRAELWWCRDAGTADVWPASHQVVPVRLEQLAAHSSHLAQPPGRLQVMHDFCIKCSSEKVKLICDY
jgi:hypothetical protein